MSAVCVDWQQTVFPVKVFPNLLLLRLDLLAGDTRDGTGTFHIQYRCSPIEHRPFFKAKHNSLLWSYLWTLQNVLILPRWNLLLRCWESSILHSGFVHPLSNMLALCLVKSNIAPFDKAVLSLFPFYYKYCISLTMTTITSRRTIICNQLDRITLKHFI